MLPVITIKTKQYIKRKYLTNYHYSLYTLSERIVKRNKNEKRHKGRERKKKRVRRGKRDRKKRKRDIQKSSQMRKKQEKKRKKKKGKKMKTRGGNGEKINQRKRRARKK